MQFHLLAFAPLLVLVGTAAMAGATSLCIGQVSSKARLPAKPKALAVAKPSAEILVFPVPQPRPAPQPRLTASATAK